ncbi:MAG: mechanosensitive ion channel [Sphingobacteriales bacterium]|nr:MAG: mechanosensitive ion channel [Sphingobacteriales bacterium]
MVLGALSVGVGLGLQGLVSNLVSGLVIAFEKPVSVGDLIEVNDKSGTMKSIGFRSSVVSLADGAYLIIPNSDLLSQHLVNWTMGKNHKKITITLGVAYGTDINQAKAVLTSILTADDRIMASPAAVVVAKDFDESAINFQLIFWIHHISESLSIRSDIIAQIDKTFKEQGIVIPFPQQEVTVKQVQGGSGGEVDKNASPAK